MTNNEAPLFKDPKEAAERARQQQAMRHYIEYLNSDTRQSELKRALKRTTSNEPQGEQHD